MTPPDILQYLDYRAFLADWFKAKKAKNARYSHRLFARKAQQRSPSLLKHVIDRKRNLTAATTEGFIVALSLKSDQARFFRLLVELDQATSADERNAAWSKISSTRRFREARQLDGDGFKYFSHWYYPAIRELAHRDDFDPDPAWIARTLHPPITEAQAKQALATLRSLALLVDDGNGGLKPAEASVVTPHVVTSLAVYNYHQGMLKRASEALETIGHEERHYGAVTVAVPDYLVPQMKAEIAAFQERILDMCDSASHEADRVYQLNLHLFPLSEARIDPEGK